MLRSCLKRSRVMSVLPEVMYPQWFRQVTLQSSYAIRTDQSLKFLADKVHTQTKAGKTVVVNQDNIKQNTFFSEKYPRSD